MAADSRRFTVKLSSRPIKLGFLVPPNSLSAIRQAIQINSFLWGGAYNPIIPMYRRLPRAWASPGGGSVPARQIMQGYIDAFDPDYLVNIGLPEAELPPPGSRRLLTGEDLSKGIEDENAPQYGIGFYELLRYFGDAELKFLRRKPLKVLFPQIALPYDLFLSSVYGGFSPSIDARFRKWATEEFGIEGPVLEFENFYGLLDPTVIFARRMTQFWIERAPPSHVAFRRCLFFLDASNAGDVIDYWNLRALGWEVVPFPKQLKNLREALEFARSCIVRHSQRDPSNSKMIWPARVLKARSITGTEFEEFAQALVKMISGQDEGTKLLTQTFYPRFWDEWARTRDNAECDGFWAEERITEVTTTSERLEFKPIAPKFAADHSGFSGPLYANLITIRTYGEDEPIAEVLPQDNLDIGSALNTFLRPDEWRLSRAGLVSLVRCEDLGIYIGAPKAQRVLSKWLESNGWKVGISPPGRMALQLLKQLGGKRWSHIIAHKGMVELLGEMSQGRSLNRGELMQRLHKMHAAGMRIEPNVALQNLTGTNLIKLGVKVRCPTCTRAAWFSLSELDYENTCASCRQPFALPAHDPKKLMWAYRGIGSVCSPHESGGAAAVILTLRFFSEYGCLELPTTPAFGVEAEKSGRKVEIDLALLTRPRRWTEDGVEFVIAECKTAGKFEMEEIRKMSWLAEQFPGAILVFATLREKLSDKEVRLLTPLVIRGRRLWKRERPLNPVMILTANELFSWMSEPSGLPKGAPLLGTLNMSQDLLQVCDLTQRGYLGMQPWRDWLRENTPAKPIR